MFTIKNLAIESMGVINITPDSFSDGGDFFSKSSVAKRIESLQNCDVIDIGAESTAPFNGQVSFGKEWERFEDYLLPNLELIKKSSRISIDTYHTETMARIAPYLKGFHEVIWNDVSGVWDDDAAKFLEENPHVSYVYSHVNVPKRSQTSDHMGYCFEKVNCDEVISYFNTFLDKNREFKNRFYLDPCFGFSKTREQNHLLLRELPKVIEGVDHPDWLVGISRKSFLRFHQGEKRDVVQETETLQTMLFQSWVESLKDKKTLRILVRLHDLVIYNAWSNFYNKLNDEGKLHFP